MSYKKTVEKINDYIVQELDLTAKEQGRIKFGIELLISGSISLGTTLIVAGLLGILNSVIFILVTASLLKLVSGGIHLKTIRECTFFTTVFFNLLGYVSLELKELIINNWLFLVCSSLYILISLFLWSPAEVAEKPLKNKKHREKLRIISLILACLLLILVTISFYLYQEKFILVNTSILLGLLFQTFTINPLAYKLHDAYYQFKAKLT